MLARLPSRLLALLIALVAVSHLGTAYAQTDAAPEAESDLAILEKTLGEIEATLSTENDCDLACAALASMVRAADKICELDAGDRCTAARKRVEEAKNRVREACPDCAEAKKRDETSERRRLESEGGSIDNEPAANEEVQAIQIDDAGCATCTVGHSGDEKLALTALLGLALLLARRRCP